ncbi:MAG: HEPN domain-containing protein [Candidatus Latescibacteria bacterium]|nr:HEPN domain-containing protein [Candidatus Latescibacterota bacterium]
MKSKEELQLVRDWLRLAQKNLQVSQSTVSADYAPYHTVCFLCQGSAERYLKTFLIHQGWELKKTHDLNELLLFCVDFDPEFETLREDCEILNEYITSSRYPGDVPSDDFDESQGREAIESAEQIQDFVLSRIDINDNVQETPEKPEDDSSGQDKDSLP